MASRIHGLCALSLMLCAPRLASAGDTLAKEEPAQEKVEPAAAEEGAAPAAESDNPYAEALGEDTEQLSDEERLARARELFSEGRQLSGESLYEQACPKFEQSLALERRASIEFNLAECYERLGRLASAYRLYSRVGEQMHQQGDDERAQIARRRAELLRGRMCGVTVEPKKVVSNMQIKLGARTLAPNLWGTVAPIDAGTYSVQVTAPGKKTWSSEVEIEACPNLVTVAVPELQDEAATAPVRKVSPAPTRQDVTAEEEAWELPVLPLAVAGAGLAGIAVGTVFAANYHSKNDDARAICPQGFNCTPAQVDQHAQLVDDAKTARTWAYVGFGVGGAALIGAAVLYFTGDYGARPSTGWNVTPMAGLERDGWGAAVQRTF